MPSDSNDMCVSVEMLCTLNDKYAELMGDATQRGLTSSVTQDSKTEEVNMPASRASVRKFVRGYDILEACAVCTPSEHSSDCIACRDAISERASNVQACRRRFIGFLQNVWMTVSVRNPATNAWLFENCARIPKWLAFSMVLEGDNLRSMGGDPDITDIPQSLVYLDAILTDATESGFWGAKENFTIMSERAPSEYIELYTQSE